MRFLTFQLYAPLAAMGNVATGEVRLSARIPRTSQLIGLFGCCLGIGRDRRQDLADMAENLGLCVMAANPAAPPMRDFHTIESPANGKDLRPHATRADELAAYRWQQRRRPPTMRPYPILSYREYLQNAPFVVAVWPTGPTAPDLENLASAMLRPHWAPYFGRKSCPLGLPLAPVIGAHPDPVAALRAYHLDPMVASLRSKPPEFWLRQTLLEAFGLDGAMATSGLPDAITDRTAPLGHGRLFSEETWRRIDV